MNSKKIKEILNKSVVWTWVVLKANGDDAEAEACVQNLSNDYAPGTLFHEMPEMAFEEEKKIFAKELAGELKNQDGFNVFAMQLKESIIDVLYSSDIDGSIIRAIIDLSLET